MVDSGLTLTQLFRIFVEQRTLCAVAWTEVTHLGSGSGSGLELVRVRIVNTKTQRGPRVRFRVRVRFKFRVGARVRSDPDGEDHLNCHFDDSFDFRVTTSCRIRISFRGIVAIRVTICFRVRVTIRVTIRVWSYD